MCHNGLQDSAGKDASIVQSWATSMMANSAKDPFWKAKVASELARNAHLTAIINDKCTTCHAPMANYEIKQNQGAEIEVLGQNGILNSTHSMHNAAMNGISCTLCHQMMDDASQGTLEGFSGHYHINDSKTIYGQFSDIFANPMYNQTGYWPEYSEHISSSEMCATCHELSTPYVDENGNILTTTPETEFPEQTPYSEWKNSIYSDSGSNPQNCQDCHMESTRSKVSNRPRWLGEKDGFSKHHLAGANTTMLTLLKDNAAALDVTSNNMETGIERARAMLQSAVTLDIISAEISNGILEVNLKLNNHSGHKTPTSYPSRRMWLNFKVTDASGQVMFESGKINNDGSIVGADNDNDQNKIEPHYDLINSEDQVQIYEAITGNSDGQTTYTLLRAAQYLKDNRLTPQGFDKAQVEDKVAVWGGAKTDNNFNNGSDIISYRIPVTVNDDLNVSIKLNYQSIMHGFIEDLYRNSNLPEVQTFKNMYDAQSLKYETITSAQTLVENSGGTTPVPVPSVDLIAYPSTAITPGESVVLSWNAIHANSCQANWSSSTATTGSESVSPVITTSYSITCSGDGGSQNDELTVIVKEPTTPAPTVSLTADPATGIEAGQTATLSWTSTNATNCTTDWTGDVAINGSQNVSPDVTTTYSINCSGTGGEASDSTSIIVTGPPVINEPTVSLNASPSQLRRGRTVTLSWVSTDASTCYASGHYSWNGNKPSSGSQTITLNNPATFLLNCRGEGGESSSSVSYNSRGKRWLYLK